MIKGLFMGLALMAAKGVLYLIYGKDGMELREKQEKNNTGASFIVMMLLIFEAIILILNLSVNDGTLSDILFGWGIVVLIPIIFVAWAVIARKNVQKELEELAKDKYFGLSEEQKYERSILDNGGWKCKKCGKLNPSYTGTCSCGNNKIDNQTMKEQKKKAAYTSNWDRIDNM